MAHDSLAVWEIVVSIDSVEAPNFSSGKAGFQFHGKTPAIFTSALALVQMQLPGWM